jgi:hypothetical protein
MALEPQVVEIGNPFDWLMSVLRLQLSMRFADSVIGGGCGMALTAARAINASALGWHALWRGMLHGAVEV